MPGKKNPPGDLEVRHREGAGWEWKRATAHGAGAARGAGEWSSSVTSLSRENKITFLQRGRSLEQARAAAERGPALPTPRSRSSSG